MKMKYWIKGERRTSLTHVEGSSMRDLFNQFVGIEEIDIFAHKEKVTVRKHLANGYSNWTFVINGRPYAMSTFLFASS